MVASSTTTPQWLCILEDLIVVLLAIATQCILTSCRDATIPSCIQGLHTKAAGENQWSIHFHSFKPAEEITLVLLVWHSTIYEKKISKLWSILKGHEKYLHDKCFRITKFFFGLISSAHFCTCEIEGGVVGGKHASYGFVPTTTICCKEPRCCLCCMAFCSIPPMNPWNLQQWKTNVQLQQWQSETSHYQAALPNMCSCCEALDASTLHVHENCCSTDWTILPTQEVTQEKLC